MSTALPTFEEVELMTSAQLVSCYNDLAPLANLKQVKKFEARSVGITRLARVTEALRSHAAKAGTEHADCIAVELIEKTNVEEVPPSAEVLNKVVKTKAPPAVKAATLKTPKVTFASRCRALILEGKTNAEIWAVLAPEFGYDEKTAVQRSHAGWHRADMKRKGVI